MQLEINLGFKVGDMVRHPGIDEPIRVKRSDGECTTVERISQPMYQSKDPHKPLGTMVYPVYIVSTKDLSLCNAPSPR